jgi:hypothetical protein
MRPAREAETTVARLPLPGWLHIIDLETFFSDQITAMFISKKHTKNENTDFQYIFSRFDRINEFLIL